MLTDDDLEDANSEFSGFCVFGDALGLFEYKCSLLSRICKGFWSTFRYCDFLTICFRVKLATSAFFVKNYICSREAGRRRLF